MPAQRVEREGVVPNVITYCALISVCEKSAEAERALQVFDGMQREGVVPNVITDSALISVCEKSGEPERALEVLD